VTRVRLRAGVRRQRPGISSDRRPVEDAMENLVAAGRDEMHWHGERMLHLPTSGGNPVIAVEVEAGTRNREDLIRQTEQIHTIDHLRLLGARELSQRAPAPYGAAAMSRHPGRPNHPISIRLPLSRAKPPPEQHLIVAVSSSPFDQGCVERRPAKAVLHPGLACWNDRIALL
jgi:hypothetical protein